MKDFGRICLACAAVLLASTMVAAQRRLGASLLNNYNRIGTAGRPVANASDPINLQLDLSLIRIVDVNQEKQTFSAVIFMKMFWTDALLKWNPEDFDGTETIQVDAAQVWTPDIELFNAAEPPLVLTAHPTRVHVSSDGSAIWVPMYRLTSSCNMAPDEDQPTCTFKLGSWVYSMSQLHLKLLEPYMDVVMYEQHRDWELLSTKAERTDKEYDCCPGVLYSHATYSIKLKRRVKRVREEKPTDNGATSRISSVFLLSAIILQMIC